MDWFTSCFLSDRLHLTRQTPNLRIRILILKENSWKVSSNFNKTVFIQYIQLSIVSHLLIFYLSLMVLPCLWRYLAIEYNSILIEMNQFSIPCFLFLSLNEKSQFFLYFVTLVHFSILTFCLASIPWNTISCHLMV